MDDTQGFDYQTIVQDALRQAVRRVLGEVAERGMPGEHHFYIGFRTDAPGIVLPRGLRQQYPEAMTVILQNQYWDLEVGEESFSVSLSFNGARQRLTVPFAALTRFVDPSAKFGLSFEREGEAEAGEETSAERFQRSRTNSAEMAPTEASPGRSELASKTPGEVVPFDPSRRR